MLRLLLVCVAVVIRSTSLSHYPIFTTSLVLGTHAPQRTQEFYIYP